jgi:guanylate kinase
MPSQDYNFVSRCQFEEYVNSSRFVEHGEFDKQGSKKTKEFEKMMIPYI